MNEGKKFENLCDAIIEDIVSTPDDQIVAETSREEIEETARIKKCNFPDIPQSSAAVR